MSRVVVHHLVTTAQSALLAFALLQTPAAAFAETSARTRTDAPFQIGTASSTGLYFILGNMICRYYRVGLKRRGAAADPLGCVAQPTLGSVDNLEKLKAGRIQFAIVQSDMLGARVGTPSTFRETEVHSVMSLHVEPVQVVVAAGRSVDSLAGLHGRTVNFGVKGSGTRATMLAIAKLYDGMLGDGAAASGFRPKVQAVPTQVQALALCGPSDGAGYLDAFVYAVGVPNSIVAHAIDACGARVIGLPEDLIAELVKDPRYLRTKIGKHVYKGQSKAVLTLGVYATLVTRADQSSDLVAKVTMALLDNFDAISKVHPAFSRLSLEKTIQRRLIAQLHPGARKVICRRFRHKVRYCNGGY